MTDTPNPGPAAIPERLERSNSALGQLMRRAQRLARIQRAVAAELPDALRAHTDVAGLDSGHLRLLVSSSVRATQLRYLERQLLARLRDTCAEAVDRLTVSVRPPVAAAPEPGHRAPVGISPAAARHLRQIAACEPDPELRAAYERLAMRTPSSNYGKGNRVLPAAQSARRGREP